MSEAGKEAARERFRREQHQILRLEFIKAAMSGLCAAPTVGLAGIPVAAVKVADETLAAAGEQAP